jgi:UDP-N-acetylglucosamine acyltransferase
MDGTHTVRGLNRIGLRRAGFDAARLRTLATAFRILFRTRTNLPLAVAEVEATLHSPDVDELLAFIRAARRGVAMGPAWGTATVDDDD